MTPVMMACGEGQVDLVVEFLKDDRVDWTLSYGDRLRYTAFLLAVRGNHVDVVRWMIASGREIGVQAEIDDYSLGEMRNALGIARGFRLEQVAQMLREFYGNQVRTRFAWRKMLKIGGRPRSSLSLSVLFLFSFLAFISSSLSNI